MDVVQRVHIVPLGYEFDRILEPIRNQRADLVYLLTDDGHMVSSADYHEELLAGLESTARRVETKSCDLADVYAVLGEVTTLAAKHADDDVRVNVSGAGTTAAIGATMACMDVATDATPYYVEPESYTVEGSAEPVSAGVEETVELPSYPIESPTRDQIAIMTFLADPVEHDERFRTTDPKKKDLIAYAESEGLSFLADRPNTTEKGKFRVLRTKIIEPLERDGYVTERKVGRRHLVELTEQGENACRAFAHKLRYGDSDGS
ncbi:DUF6293 family protein [Natronoglomus mannanivorans]|uniref:DUF6293 family protein n=1 Tax=Natronoglomus mannanivorans TaxID=2979990 RepID=A0AAP3E304_9EURY|nr:DUF6293 family protein [Halobacteria archaeon AArc-xg1-1]